MTVVTLPDRQRPSEITRIKTEVRARDDYRCTKCGLTNAQHYAKYGKALDVHRLVPGSVYTVEGSVTLCRICHGPEPRRGPGQIDWANPTVRVYRDLLKRARVIAAHRRIRVADYLAEILSPIIEEHEAQLLEDIARERKKKIHPE